MVGKWHDLHEEDQPGRKDSEVKAVFEKTDPESQRPFASKPQGHDRDIQGLPEDLHNPRLSQRWDVDATDEPGNHETDQTNNRQEDPNEYGQ